MPKVGLSDLHYALLTADTGTAATYSASVAVAGLIDANIQVASEITTLFADNGPYATSSSLGEITIDINLADLDVATQAALLGHTVTAGGIMQCTADDTAPEVAIGFTGLKSNGKKRFIWLTKGTFSVPDDSYKTKGDTVEFQQQTITGKFVARVKDSVYKLVGDEDATGWTTQAATDWFVANKTLNNPVTA